MSEVLPDLAGLIGCYIGIALLSILIPVLIKLEKAANFSLSIPHVKTFHINVGTWIWGGLISSLEDAAKALEHWATRFEQDIATMFEVLVALPILAAEGLYKGMQTLWQIGLDKAISPALKDIRDLIAAAQGRADTVYNGIYNSGTSLPGKISSAISAAAASATSNAIGWVRAQGFALGSDVTAAIGVAEHYADTALDRAKSYADGAVGTLRKAEDAAVASVASIAAAAEQDAQRALSSAAGALTTAEGYADRAIADARSALSSAIVAAEAQAESVAAQALAAAQSTLQQGINAASAAAAAAEQTATSAITTAEGYADAQLAAAKADLSALVGKTVSDAVGDVTKQLADLAAQTEGEVADAVRTAAAAAADLDAAIKRQIAAAEALAAAGASAVGGAAAEAINAVKSIAVGVGDEIDTLVGPLGVTGAAALIASIPALATLVHAIASEAGLENSSCRGKVKNICQTDPKAWEHLLGIAGFLTIAFDLPEFVKAATIVAGGIGAGVAELEKTITLTAPPFELAA